MVSLAIPSELSARINEVCSEKRIVRDAFFNRLFLLLATSPKVIDKLYFGTYADEWRSEVWSECKHDGPFFQNGYYPLEPMIDPFWAIRAGLEIFGEVEGAEDYTIPESNRKITVMRNLTGEIAPVDSLYTTVFNMKIRDHELTGLSCYVPDWRIPGQPAETKYRSYLDEIFSELEDLP